MCAGVQGTLALDDAFVAGRIVEPRLGTHRCRRGGRAPRDDLERAEAFRASKSGRNLMENALELEPDILFCARESVLDVVPRSSRCAMPCRNLGLSEDEITRTVDSRRRRPV